MVALPEAFVPSTVADDDVAPLPTAHEVIALSPFQLVADGYVEAGYSVIPIWPGLKKPGKFNGDEWRDFPDWPSYAARQRATPGIIHHWKGYSDAGIGIILGSVIGDHQVIALDFDTDHEDELDALQSAIPDSPMKKRGARGYTAFYRASLEMRTKRFQKLEADGTRRTVLEYLSGNATRQTVMPPSIHPTAGQYGWFAGARLVAAHELPILENHDIERLEDTLSHLGCTASGEPSRPAATNDHLVGDGFSTGDFRDINEAALANLDAWVPHLDLPKTAKQKNGRWEAVADWRASTEGRPTHERKPSLKFHPSGIKDMGSDDRYTACNVVMAAKSCDSEQAFAFLRDKLGIKDETGFIDNITVSKQRMLAEANDGSLYDQSTGEVVGLPSVSSEAVRQRNGSNDNEKPAELSVVCAADLAGKPIPPREFFVPGLIPKGKVTLLTGDGGTGKSLLGLMLAASSAMGETWLNMPVSEGDVLVLSAEDDMDEVHRRLASIVGEGRLSQLHRLHIAPLVGVDPILGAPDRATGRMAETALFQDLKRKLAKLKPGLLVLDTLADMFGGDEIKRDQARGFVAMLNRLTAEFGVTILLLSHPSQSGMESGRGTSGSTAWSNSVRSRLYLKHHEDPDMRVLEVMKTNTNRPGTKYLLRWQDGYFERVDERQQQADDLGDAKSEFLRLLEEFTGQGRPPSPNVSSGYAPKLFAEEMGNRITKAKLKAAMNALLRERKIEIVEDGPPSRRRYYLAIAQASSPASDPLSEDPA